MLPAELYNPTEELTTTAAHDSLIRLPARLRCHLKIEDTLGRGRRGDTERREFRGMGERSDFRFASEA